MSNPLVIFQSNIKDADALGDVFQYLTSSVGNAFSFDDLLRSKIVYSVSAFDKLIHDLVRRGMVDIFIGNRVSTPKFNNEAISIQAAKQLATTSTPPPEVIFEQLVQAKLKIMSFQEPDKVSDGLSYIWPEQQKWARIAAKIGEDERHIKTKLKLISSRRNSIVHEADMDPMTHTKLPISKPEADDITNFLLKLGNAIESLV